MTNSQTKESKPYIVLSESHYDFNYATWHDSYTLWKLKKTLFGKYKYVQMTDYIGYPYDITVTVGGDIDWAKKTAKELNIKVPKIVRSL